MLAVPPSLASALLADSFPELSARMGRIRTTTVESVGVVVSAQKLAIPPVAGIIARDDLFYSAVRRDTVPDPSYRGFAFHFRPESPADARLDRVASVLGVERRDFELVVEYAD